LVKRRRLEGRTVYLRGECGFGYEDEETAKECEEWCSFHKSCNLEIMKKAVYTP